MPTRNQSIDLVKVIAMFMVLLLHTGVARHCSSIDYTSVPQVYLIAGIAIPMFFMVSGYLLSTKEPSFAYSARKTFGILKFTFIMCAGWKLLAICAKYLSNSMLNRGAMMATAMAGLLPAKRRVLCILVFWHDAHHLCPLAISTPTYQRSLAAMGYCRIRNN